MTWFSSAARMGTVLPLALLFFVSVPVVTSPCYGQTGTLPNNAQGINDNYDALEKLIDQAEASLKDAIANGDTQKANAMRRNLRFYAKRLARLENVATGIAKRTKDSQMVEKLSKLQGRVTRILDRSRCGRGPRRVEPGIAQVLSLVRTARNVIPIRRLWRLLSRTANG